jgi:hypothetical protein
MSAAAILAADPAGKPTATGGLLPTAGLIWFLVALAGQWTFVYYIAGFYGASTASGDYALWNHKEHLKGYVPGDTAGNLAFASHVLMAAVLTVAGTMQLIPWIRANIPVLHRWTGRVFLATAAFGAVTGLYMVWIRQARTGIAGDVAITLDAVLILLFAGVTLNRALARDFDEHRRWAMRTFMVVNAVWFLRVSVIPPMLVNKLLGGAKQGIDGPIYSVLVFACYLIPLAILELYQLARDRFSPGGRRAVAGLMLVSTAYMAIGIVFAWLFMWSPVLAKR